MVVINLVNTVIIIAMRSLKQILADKNLSNIGKYVTREYQDYGLRLAQSLNDMEHKSLYIKLAKSTQRNFLEEALVCVKDASHIKSKARLFMWKLKKLKDDAKMRKESSNFNNSNQK